jgi:hypothetical protein
MVKDVAELEGTDKPNVKLQDEGEFNAELPCSSCPFATCSLDSAHSEHVTGEIVSLFVFRVTVWI